MPNKNSFKSNKDGSKLNQKYVNEQQIKQQVFFAKHQNKAFKAQKAQTETVDAEFLDFLQVLISYHLFPDNTCGVTGSFSATKSLPQLNSGDKEGCSKVEYHNSTSIFAPEVLNSEQTFRTFCGGNDRDIFNTIPKLALQEMMDKLRDKNPGIAHGLKNILEHELVYNCQGVVARNLTNEAKPNDMSTASKVGIGLGVAAGGITILVAILLIYLQRTKRIFSRCYERLEAESQKLLGDEQERYQRSKARGSSSLLNRLSL